MCAGKWASASAKEVEDMKAKGVPHCYRCEASSTTEAHRLAGQLTFRP